jgi:hypothetical protein
MAEKTPEEIAAEAAMEDNGKKGIEVPVQTIDDIARELSWRPLDEFNGDPEKWVDAATFIKNGVQVQKKLQRHVKELEKGVADLKIHNETVYKARVQKLQDEIKTLKEERKTAIAEGNVALVEQIDEKIETAKESIPSKPVSPADDEVNEKFNAWVGQNAWYVNDPEMKKYADKIGEKYSGAPIEKILQKVEEGVRELWPETFNGKRDSTRQVVDPVEGGGRRVTAPGGRKSYSWNNLSDRRRSIGDRFVREGIMTRADYIQDLVDSGAI